MEIGEETNGFEYHRGYVDGARAAEDRWLEALTNLGTSALNAGFPGIARSISDVTAFLDARRTPMEEENE